MATTTFNPSYSVSSSSQARVANVRQNADDAFGELDAASTNHRTEDAFVPSAELADSASPSSNAASAIGGASDAFGDLDREAAKHPVARLRPAPSTPQTATSSAPAQTGSAHQPGDYSWIKNPSLRHTAEENYKRAQQQLQSGGQ